MRYLTLLVVKAPNTRLPGFSAPHRAAIMAQPLEVSATAAGSKTSQTITSTVFWYPLFLREQSSLT
jgi:hypothetical protein